MAKDPAFLFYFRDFAHGTRRFNFEQKGLYIELLCEQADSETGSICVEDMNNICLSCDKDTIKTVLAKFSQDDNGYYNAKLREVITLRKKYSDSRRKNRMGKKKSDEKTYVNHMANANADANADQSSCIKIIQKIESFNGQLNSFQVTGIKETVSEYDALVVEEALATIDKYVREKARTVKHPDRFLAQECSRIQTEKQLKAEKPPVQYVGCEPGEDLSQYCDPVDENHPDKVEI